MYRKTKYHKRIRYVFLIPGRLARRPVILRGALHRGDFLFLYFIVYISAYVIAYISAYNKRLYKRL